MHSLLVPPILAALTLPAVARDIKPDPADVEEVRALLKKATTALIDENSQDFVDCCDTYIDCFLADGTLVKGKR